MRKCQIVPFLKQWFTNTYYDPSNHFFILTPNFDKLTWTHLLRSKSCERPKMRDTFRMDKFAANFNRISSNITDKLLSSTSHISSNSSNKPEYHNHHNSSKDSQNTSEDSCREIDPVSPNNSLLQSVAFRAIPCVDIQVSKIFY